MPYPGASLPNVVVRLRRSTNEWCMDLATFAAAERRGTEWTVRVPKEALS